MSTRRWPVVLGLLLLTGAASISCTSSAADPRCRVEAQGRHVPKITKVVNASDLMQAYFDEVESFLPGRALLSVSLTMDRDQRKVYGGDYDPGNVTITFKVTSLRGAGTLYEREEEVDLEPFMIGLFDGNASREEIQEIAFKATEDKIYPYLARWTDLAAIRAMGQEGVGGKSFVPMLSGLIEDQWTSADLRKEARNALEKINGSA